MKVKELLKTLEIGTIIEFYDIRANLIVKAPTDEILLYDEGLLDKEILIVTPQHSARENYLEITIY